MSTRTRLNHLIEILDSENIISKKMNMSPFSAYRDYLPVSPFSPITKRIAKLEIEILMLHEFLKVEKVKIQYKEFLKKKHPRPREE